MTGMIKRCLISCSREKALRPADLAKSVNRRKWISGCRFYSTVILDCDTGSSMRGSNRILVRVRACVGNRQSPQRSEDFRGYRTAAIRRTPNVIFCWHMRCSNLNLFFFSDLLIHVLWWREFVNGFEILHLPARPSQFSAVAILSLLKKSPILSLTVDIQTPSALLGSKSRLTAYE